MNCPNCKSIDHGPDALFCHMCGSTLSFSFDKFKRKPEKFHFEWAESFSEGLAMITIGAKSGFIDKAGNYVIEPIYNIGGSYSFAYDNHSGFSEGLSVVCMGDSPDRKYGCVDRWGNYVIPPQYDCIWPFSEGLAAVRSKDKWGFINKKGQMVVPTKYESVCHYSEGFAIVQLGWHKYVYLDTTGKIAIEKTKNVVFNWEEGFPIRKAHFEFGSSFHEGFARVECAGKKGYIDKTGIFFRCKFDSIDDFSEGLASFSINGFRKCGYIDKKMNIVINPIFDEARKFHEHKAAVRIGNKFGFIDKAGQLIVPCIFDNASSFHEGLAAIELNKKIGYIDPSGTIVIQPRYHSARGFSEGFAAVEENGAWGYIDKFGNIVYNN